MVRIARFDHRDAIHFAVGAVPGIQPQPGLARGGIRAVAGVAILGKDRLHLPREVHLAGPGHGGHEREQQDSREARHEPDGYGREVLRFYIGSPRAAAIKVGSAISRSYSPSTRLAPIGISGQR